MSSPPARTTARLLPADYDVPPELITIARARHRPRPDRRRQPRRHAALLSVGAVVPRKGFDVLVEALARLADLPWRLDDRRRSHPRSADCGAARCRYRAPLGLGDRIDGARRVAVRAARRALRRRRSVRAGVAFRGLRHGLCRGDRARPAGCRHHRAARSPTRCRPMPACWSRQTTCGAGAHAAAADRECRRAALARGRRARGGRRRCRPGQDSARCSRARSRRCA